MNTWINFVGYELVWFCAVISAGEGHAWPGVVAALLFALWQCSVSRQRGSDLRLIAVAVIFGLLVDGGLGASGLASYASAWPVAWLAPAWILALWLAFALTLNHTLTFLQRHPWCAVVLGAAGGPLAYSAASRGWHVVNFVQPAWRALVYLAIAWAVAMWVLSRLAHQWQRGDLRPRLRAAGQAR